MLACWVILPAGFTVRHSVGARVQVFALLIGAGAFVPADAKGFIAVRLDKVKLCVLGRCWSARSFALKRRRVAFACLAFACLAFAAQRCGGVAWRALGRWGWSCTKL